MLNILQVKTSIYTNVYSIRVSYYYYHYSTILTSGSSYLLFPFSWLTLKLKFYLPDPRLRKSCSHNTLCIRSHSTTNVICLSLQLDYKLLKVRKHVFVFPGYQYTEKKLKPSAERINARVHLLK